MNHEDQIEGPRWQRIRGHIVKIKTKVKAGGMVVGGDV
jgi:hypothetical protein